MAKSFLGYLHRRGAVFYFRRGIPSPLRPCFGMRELFWSLGPLAQPQAEQLALHSLLFSEEIFAAARDCPCFPDPARFRVLVDDFKHQLRDRCRPNNRDDLQETRASLHMRRERLSTPVLMGVMGELHMTDKYGIDPRFKTRLQQLFRDLVEHGLTEFEDAYLGNPNGMAVEPLERLRDSLGLHLSSPQSAMGQLPPDSPLASLFDLIQQEYADLGDSNPEAAHNYRYREFTKAVYRLIDGCVRLIKDPGYSLAAIAAGAPSPSSSQPAPNAAPTVWEAWQEYAHEKRHDWKPGTQREYERTLQEFISDDFTGNKRVDLLTRDDLVEYRNRIRRLPAGRTKHKEYREKTISELLQMDIPPKHQLRDRSVNERLVLLISFFKWCREVKGYTDKDLGYRVLLTNPRSAERADFTPTEIGQLFHPAHYRPQLIGQPYKYWIPLLGLYTGARLSELAQLRPDNIFQTDGVIVIQITDDGEGQKVKTRAGKRLVPVHSHLLTLGFLEYVGMIQRQRSQFLFPDLKRAADKAGDTASKWFTRFRRQRGVEDSDPQGREKVFHSFRHTLVTTLRRGSHEIGVIQQLIGHEKSLFGATDIYTKDFPLTQCQAAVESLDFGLDIPALKEGWKAVVEHHKRHPHPARPAPARRQK